MSRTKITIVHDSFGHPSSLRKDWGFSALLEFDGQRILFDTGNSARTFSENCSALDLDLRNLDYAVISHRHGDHTSGLNHLLKVNPKLTVHTPEETYGVFGSSLFGSFYPRCHSLPRYFQYYDGNPPEVIRHGSPWPDANFVWVKETTETSEGVFLVPVVSDVPGTREMREISVVLRTSSGLVLIAGCSHPGIEKILEAAHPIADRVLCIFGGLHLVLTKEPEIRRVVSALRDDWHVERIAPGHCTGELAFAAIREIFGERCLFAGLGESIEL